MATTFSEMSDLISTLEAELAIVLSANETARAAELRVAIDDVTFLRAQSLVAEGNELARYLAAARISVEQVISRIHDRTTITSIVNSGAGLGVTAPSAGLSNTNSDLIESLRTEPPVPVMNTSTPSPTGGSSTFVTAHKTATKTVLLVDDQGREFVRIGGSRSWRNFNPGNIRKGSFSTNNGAIGDDGSFAIFSDKKTGLKAIEILLRGRSYGPLTIKAAINRYAPPSENNTDAYVGFVVQEAGLNHSSVLDDLKINEIRKIIAAIEKMEGWKFGEERPHLPASGFDNATPIGAGNGAGISAAIGASSDWMEIAQQEAALPVKQRSEVHGFQSNPRILNYFSVGATWYEPENGDETEWCAAFVNYCLETSGYVGTNHPGARSFFWNKKRQFIKLNGPRKYCIAVRRYAPFSDAAWETGRGHVGFVVDYSDTQVTLLGGNQSNSVTEKTFQRRVLSSNGTLQSEFVAFMMPVMN